MSQEELIEIIKRMGLENNYNLFIEIENDLVGSRYSFDNLNIENNGIKKITISKYPI